MDPNTGLAAVHAAAAQPNMISRADHDAAIAAASAAGVTEGKAQGCAAERTRIKAVLGGKEAAGRTALAQHLAFDTDMPAEAATAVLAKAPKEEAKGSQLDGKVPQPNVNASPAAGEPDAAGRWDAVVAQLNKESRANHSGRSA